MMWKILPSREACLEFAMARGTEEYAKMVTNMAFNGPIKPDEVSDQHVLAHSDIHRTAQLSFSCGIFQAFTNDNKMYIVGLDYND